MKIFAVEIRPGHIKIEYADGSREEVEAGFYERKNSERDTVEERAATQVDLDRLSALAAGFEASLPIITVQVVEVAFLGAAIEIKYADGSKEKIANGFYERKNSNNETILERVAASEDRSRLQALASDQNTGVSDDGTPDQGSGDATPTPGSDDGTPDQGSGDATPTPGSDDGTPDQGSGDNGASGSASDDRLRGGSGDDTLDGMDGDDDLRGRDGNDTLSGGTGNDDIRGGRGDDTAHGGTGDDRLRGDHGDDDLYGDAGSDRIYGGLGSDYIEGGDGRDYLRGNRGVDTLHGGEGNDHIRGGGSSDWMSGDAGDDFILGEGGKDYIAGGAGNDTLFGGWSNGLGDGLEDCFVFKSSADGGGGFDRIRDWEDGIDVIDLSAFGFNDFDTEVASLASNSGSALRINFGGGDVIYIDGFQLADFDSSDVILF